MFPALKVFCMDKSGQNLDVDKELSKCWFRDVVHLESSKFYLFPVLSCMVLGNSNLIYKVNLFPFNPR